MGKYMRKTKIDGGEIAVMEVTTTTTQSSLGVRTRAKTLALQRLHDPNSYLQLRDRRLEKPPPPPVSHDATKRRRQGGSAASGVDSSPEEKNEEEGRESGGDLGIEASFGENVPEAEGRERGTRESTPCDLIRDPDIITTPGSTTRSSSLTSPNRRVHNSVRIDIPSANELDTFFFSAEKEQQKSFIDKYNFDPVTDKPLPGRFEWEKLNL